MASLKINNMLSNILLTMLVLITFLKIIFVYFCFSTSGCESLIIYTLLIYSIYSNKTFLTVFIKKMLIFGSIITLFSMLLKIDSCIQHDDITFLLDNTPAFTEMLRDFFFNTIESAPKGEQKSGPELKPQLVEFWVNGDYRLLSQNLGEGALKTMSVSGFIMVCKPALLTTKTGKIIIGASAMAPFIDHVFK
jgi:hypothetical protein